MFLKKSSLFYQLFQQSFIGTQTGQNSLQEYNGDQGVHHLSACERWDRLQQTKAIENGWMDEVVAVRSCIIQQV